MEIELTTGELGIEGASAPELSAKSASTSNKNEEGGETGHKTFMTNVDE